MQALLRADEEAQAAFQGGGTEEGEEEDEEGTEEEAGEGGANYDELIELGRHIGDVKVGGSPMTRAWPCN